MINNDNYMFNSIIYILSINMLDKNWYWYIIDETIINTFLIHLMRKIILFLSLFTVLYFFC